MPSGDAPSKPPRQRQRSWRGWAIAVGGVALVVAVVLAASFGAFPLEGVRSALDTPSESAPAAPPSSASGTLLADAGTAGAADHDLADELQLFDADALDALDALDDTGPEDHDTYASSDETPFIDGIHTLCGDDTPVNERSGNSIDERLSRKGTPLQRRIEAFAQRLDGATDEPGRLIAALLRDDWPRAISIAEATTDPAVFGMVASRCSAGHPEICARVPASRWMALDPGNLLPFWMAAGQSPDTAAARSIMDASRGATHVGTGDELALRRFARMGFASPEQGGAVLLKMSPPPIGLTVLDAARKVCPEGRHSADPACQAFALQAVHSDLWLAMRVYMADWARPDDAPDDSELPGLPSDARQLLDALDRRSGADRARLAECDGLMQDFRYQLDRLDRGDIDLAREQLAREAEDQRKTAGKRASEASGASARPPAG